MSRFITNTAADIRHGRQSWRVFVAFCTPAFLLTVVFALSLHSSR